jgi:hypothetical protein
LISVVVVEFGIATWSAQPGVAVPIPTLFALEMLIAVPEELADVIPSTPPAGRFVSDAPEIAGNAPDSRLDVIVSAVVCRVAPDWDGTVRV